MAKHQGKVYLGYEEETVSDKSQSLLNYTVNKIGGFPDWPPLENVQYPSKCPLCGLHRLLIVQCYAPLENSVYHRTLYVFACINPNCWIQSESWSCVRSQYQEPIKHTSAVVNVPSVDTNLSWCSGADEWDENDNGDSANGNFMNIDNAPSPNNGIHRNSDEDEESNSFEVESVEQALGNLQMYDAHNANMSPVQGAMGAIGVPVAEAELEGGEEPGLVTVDTPTAPTDDIDALLHQTAELPQDIRSRLVVAPMQFVPKYIYVEPEWHDAGDDDDRVMELLNKYKMENELDAGEVDDEQYEESVPLHGDRLFHTFLSRLRENPGQILRYSREAPPLLGAALPGAAPERARGARGCARCGARLLPELQLLPALAGALGLPPRAPRTPRTPAHLRLLSALVLTCAQSCWQPGDTLRPETVIFQQEVL